MRGGEITASAAPCTNGRAGTISTPFNPNALKSRLTLKQQPLPIAVGEVAERSKAAVLKTVVGQPTGGSNPSLSAKYNK